MRRPACWHAPALCTVGAPARWPTAGSTCAYEWLNLRAHARTPPTFYALALLPTVARKWQFCLDVAMLRNGVRILGLAAVLALLPAATAAEPLKIGVVKLVAEADRVWRLTETGEFVAAVAESEVLVRAADALRASGKPELAREYYRRAGLVRPWDFETKLRQAEVLQQLGDAAAARSVAEQIQAFAESDRLLAASAALAGGEAQPELPLLASLVPEPGEVVVGLVAAAGTEQWLLRDVGWRLSRQLGVRVGLAAETFELGDPTETGRGVLANGLRQSMPWKDKRMALYIPGGKLVDPATLSDQVVIAVMDRFLQREGEREQLVTFRYSLEKADVQQWWDVSRILRDLSAKHVQSGPGRVVRMALVPVDLLPGSSAVLFGSAIPDGNYGVVSYHRFAARVTGEPPSRSRLVGRVGKQMLSSMGFALGVPRCADPRCARSYPRSLADHDAKGAGLCADCRAGFAKALGHELP